MRRRHTHSVIANMLPGADGKWRTMANETSTVQAKNLLKIASALRIPKVMLVGDAKQLDAVDAGKPFAQLQQAGIGRGASAVARPNS